MAAMASNRAHETLDTVACDLCGCSDSTLLFTVRDKYRDGGQEFSVVRCRSCCLVYVNPRPAVESIGDFYPAEYYDGEVFHCAESSSTLLDVENRRLKDIARFVPGGRIMDVGCGSGRFLSVARSSGWIAQGTEVSDLAAEYARDHYGLDVIGQDLLSVGFPDECFDVVTMWGVLEHLHHPRASLQEVSRILKPNGLLVALVPNIGSTQARIFGSRWYLLDVPRHLYHFSRVTLNRLAASAGLCQVWARFFASEHDVPNLIESWKMVLWCDTPLTGRPNSEGSASSKRRWTRRRVLMGILRRTAPLMARVMAGRHSSAAMELYFVKPGLERGTA